MASQQLISRIFTLLGRSIQSSVDRDAWGTQVNNIADAKTRIVLTKNNWSFAIRHAELAREVISDSPEYDYQYRAGFEIVRILDVFVPYTEDDRIRTDRPLLYELYEINGNSVFTNEERILIKYISSNIDIAIQDQAFIDAIAYLSAAEAALVLLERPSLNKQMIENYLFYKNVAVRNDVKPGKPVPWRTQRRSL